MRALNLLCLAAVGVAAVAVPFGSQEPLAAGRRRRASGATWKAVEQDDDICRAGSLQFSGTINVTDHKSIFFWFVESREDPNNRPIILWLNGGPGASSLMGMFNEMGPCIVNEYGNDTTFNPYSWSKDFNLLFIDQPAGVGFSTTNDSSEWPSTLKESSQDFSATLRVFFSEIFPQYSTVPFYIAGESFGGNYAPRFVSDIVKAQADPYRLDAKLIPPIAGIILVDAAVDQSYDIVGQYEMFCNGFSDYLKFNESTCDAIAKAVPECEKLAGLCRSTMDPYVCQETTEFCSEEIGKYFQDEVWGHKHSPYDIRNDCPNPPICLPFNTSEAAVWLNTPKTQSLLELDHYIHYEPVNFVLNTRWSSHAEIHLPTTHDVSFLLDEPKIRFLVVNGDCDVIINTPGILRQFDEMPWHQQAKYRAQPIGDWYWIDENGVKHVGGEMKTIPQLTIAGVREAGHMSPEDQRAPVQALVRDWVFSA